MGVFSNIKEKADEKKKARMITDQEIIATAIADLRNQCNILERTSESYIGLAAEAARLGDDEYATELIECAAEFDAFISKLKVLELRIKTHGLTVGALSNLGLLPNAIGACVRLSKSLPDFKKMGKDMSDLRSVLGTARKSLDDFCQSFKTNKPNDIYIEMFGEPLKKEDDAEFKKRVADKRKAVEHILAMDSSAAPAPTDATVTATDMAKIDDIAAMIDSENNKG